MNAAPLDRETDGRARVWDPSFARRSPIFEPLVAAARRLEGLGAFPEPEELDAALAELAGVRFVRAEPRRRRARREPSALYDARITRDGEVPTRSGSWHDLLNALVWATFPRAKRALHARQHALVVPARPGESARRSRALDALALLDEGGVVVAAPDGAPSAGEAELARALERGEAQAFVFGHAIYESLVRGWRTPTASVVAIASAPELGAVDRALAAVLAAPAALPDPRAMPRLPLDRLEGLPRRQDGRSIPLTD